MAMEDQWCGGNEEAGGIGECVDAGTGVLWLSMGR